MDRRAVAAALAAIRRAGVHVALVDGRPTLDADHEPPRALLDALRAGRDTLVALLEAEALLAAAARRVQARYLAAPEPKPPVDGPDWKQLEEALTAAFASGDPQAARAAVQPTSSMPASCSAPRSPAHTPTTAQATGSASRGAGSAASATRPPTPSWSRAGSRSGRRPPTPPRPRGIVPTTAACFRPRFRPCVKPPNPSAPAGCSSCRPTRPGSSCCAPTRPPAARGSPPCSPKPAAPKRANASPGSPPAPWRCSHDPALRLLRPAVDRRQAGPDAGAAVAARGLPAQGGRARPRGHGRVLRPGVGRPRRPARLDRADPGGARPPEPPLRRGRDLPDLEAVARPRLGRAVPPRAAQARRRDPLRARRRRPRDRRRRPADRAAAGVRRVRARQARPRDQARHAPGRAAGLPLRRPAPLRLPARAQPHPVAARAKAGEAKTRLAPDPAQAKVVAEIFQLWADRAFGCQAIADRLNRPGGPPSPNHVDRRRNRRRDWAKSTLRAMLRNPTYTGRLVWNRLDFASQREAGGTARLRAEEEWVVSEVEHLPLVSDELFAKAQERFKQRPRSNGRRGTRAYLFSGMVRCASGHQPLAMYGRSRKQPTYT